jgi:hypothetical protein
LAAIDADHVEARQTIFDNLVLAVIPRATKAACAGQRSASPCLRDDAIEHQGLVARGE